MKKITTTKLVLMLTLLFCGILEALIVVSWIFLDKEGAAALAGVVAAPASVVIGFYEWKAKNENISKYGTGSQPDSSNDEDQTPVIIDDGQIPVTIVFDDEE